MSQIKGTWPIDYILITKATVHNEYAVRCGVLKLSARAAYTKWYEVNTLPTRLDIDFVKVSVTQYVVECRLLLNTFVPVRLARVGSEEFYHPAASR